MVGDMEDAGGWLLRSVADDVAVAGGVVDVVGGWGGGGRRCAAGHEKGGEGLGQQWSLPRDGGGAYLSAWAVLWWSRRRIAEAMISMILIEAELENAAPDLWLCHKKA